MTDEQPTPDVEALKQGRTDRLVSDLTNTFITPDDAQRIIAAYQHDIEFLDAAAEALLD